MLPFSKPSAWLDEEIGSLNQIASRSLYAEGMNAETIRYSFEVFSRHFRSGNALEMGPAEGVMTGLLSLVFDDLTVVEGSSIFCDQLKNRYPRVDVINCLFEQFQPARKYDNIILGHVLEHVEDPVGILRQVSTWLSPQGKVFAAVPNARSIHRQAAVLMGMLPSIFALNEMDRRHGHRRVYSPETFRGDFAMAGLRVDIMGGYWLKPLSNRQIEEGWNSEMLRAFMCLGEFYPDIAAEIYVIASLPAREL